MLVNFMVVQFVPGGPVEQLISEITGDGVEVTARVGGGAGQEISTSTSKQSEGKEASGLSSQYRGAQGIPPELIKEIEIQFGTQL